MALEFEFPNVHYLPVSIEFCPLYVLVCLLLYSYDSCLSVSINTVQSPCQSSNWNELIPMLADLACPAYRAAAAIYSRDLSHSKSRCQLDWWQVPVVRPVEWQMTLPRFHTRPLMNHVMQSGSSVPEEVRSMKRKERERERKRVYLT